MNYFKKFKLKLWEWPSAKVYVGRSWNISDFETVYKEEWTKTSLNKKRQTGYNKHLQVVISAKEADLEGCPNFCDL